MSEHKLVNFEDEDRDIIISDLLGDIRLKFSFTSERLFMSQKELKEFIKALQSFEQEETV